MHNTWYVTSNGVTTHRLRTSCASWALHDLKQVGVEERPVWVGLHRPCWGPRAFFFLWLYQKAIGIINIAVETAILGFHAESLEETLVQESDDDSRRQSILCVWLLWWAWLEWKCFKTTGCPCKLRWGRGLTKSSHKSLRGLYLKNLRSPYTFKFHRPN